MAIHLIICAALCDSSSRDVTSVFCSTDDYWLYEEWRFYGIFWTNFLFTPIAERSNFRRAFPLLVPFGAILIQHFTPSFAMGQYTEVLLFRDDSPGPHRGLSDAYIRLPHVWESPDRFTAWYHYAQPMSLRRWWEVECADDVGLVSFWEVGDVSFWASMGELPAPPWLSSEFDDLVSGSMRNLLYGDAEIARYYDLRCRFYRLLTLR